MINYFPYEYPEPTRDELLSLNVEIATCPWADSHRLVRIGLKARNRAMSQANSIGVPPRLVQIAREVKIGVKFSPAEAGSYQLIGYERQAADKQNANHNEIDVGDMAAGHAVTVLFEVVPPSSPAANVRGADSSNPRSNEMLTVKLRYKRTNSDKSEVVEREITDGGKQFANASPDFKFAAAVAEFGMLLRDSEFKGNASFGAVMEWAEEGKAWMRMVTAPDFLNWCVRLKHCERVEAIGRSRGSLKTGDP